MDLGFSSLVAFCLGATTRETRVDVVHQRIGEEAILESMLSCKEEKRPSIRSFDHPLAPRQAWYISFHKTGRSCLEIGRERSLRHLLYFGRRECRIRLMYSWYTFFRLLSLCLRCCILYLWMYLSRILGPNRPNLWPGVYNWVTGTPQNFTRTRVFACVCGSSHEFRIRFFTFGVWQSV